VLPFWGRGGSFLFYPYNLFRKNTNSHDNTYGEGACLGASRPAPPQGQGPRAPQFLGSFLLVHTICRKSTETDVVTHRGEVACFRGSATPPFQRGRAPALPNKGARITHLHPLLYHQPTFHDNTIPSTATKQRFKVQELSRCHVTANACQHPSRV